MERPSEKWIVIIRPMEAQNRQPLQMERSPKWNVRNVIPASKITVRFSANMKRDSNITGEDNMEKKI